MVQKQAVTTFICIQLQSQPTQDEDEGPLGRPADAGGGSLVAEEPIVGSGVVQGATGTFPRRWKRGRDDMKGNQQVVAVLNDTLRNAHSAFMQFSKHALWFKDKGYNKLAELEEKEAAKEKDYIDKLAYRILFLNAP